MAEFAMVTVMLMMLFLALVSVGLWLYSRTILTAAAADAARYVANAEIAPNQVVVKIEQILGTGIVGSTAYSLHCSESDQGVLVGVTCTMRTPGIISLLDGVLPELTVSGHSAKEAP